MTLNSNQIMSIETFREFMRKREYVDSTSNLSVMFHALAQEFVGWGFYPNTKCPKIIKPSVTRNQTLCSFTSALFQM